LLTRFDLIWVIKDVPEREHDELITEHILDTQTGEISGGSPDESDDAEEVYCVGEEDEPKISVEARNMIKKFYSDLRGSSADSQGKTPMSITARQLESIIRLTEASARMHMRVEAVKEDAETAIQVMNESLTQLGFDPVAGVIDIDRVEGRIPKSKREKRDGVLSIIDSLSVLGEPVPKREIVEEAEHRFNMGGDEVDNLLVELLNDCVIREAKQHRYVKVK